MRTAALVGILALVIVPAYGQVKKPPPPPVRYGIEPDLDTYPQATAKQALASVLKAIDARRIDYLLAHLADPAFVDKRVQELGGRFDELVRVTTDNLFDDPESLRELRKLLNEGQWQDGPEVTTVRHKDIKTRVVYLKKLNDRWFLENRRNVGQ